MPMMDEEHSDATWEKVHRARAQHEKIKARARRNPFSDDAYQHYDPSGTRGSAEDWAHVARMLLAELGLDQVKAPPAGEPLAILARGYSPPSREALLKDFRTAAKVTHPDFGGSGDEFRRVVKVYESIKHRRRW